MVNETFSTSWGAVLATTGVAIGLGNIWRFPYMMGLFGGASFLLVYALLLILFGVPALITEWTLGRATRRGPLGAFKEAGFPAGRVFGVLILITVSMSASYYVVILSWVLDYLAVYLFHYQAGAGDRIFSFILGSFWSQFAGVVAILFLSSAGLYFGVRRGIERISKAAMPLFFLLLLILVFRTLTLEGAGDGLRYYLLPRWDQITPATLMAALGQAFFSLGLGGSMMITYGSYLNSDIRIPATAVATAFSDFFAAFLAGLVVVPAVVAFAIPLSTGPTLMFDAMPGVFEQMPGGRWFAVLFFFSILLVGTLSMMAAMEVIVEGLVRHLPWSRATLLFNLSLLLLILSVPAVISLDYIAASDLIWGTTMQPVGAVVALLAATWSLGRARMLKEIGWESTVLYYWVKYVVPAGILVALIYGWLGF